MVGLDEQYRVPHFNVASSSIAAALRFFHATGEPVYERFRKLLQV